MKSNPKGPATQTPTFRQALIKEFMLELASNSDMAAKGEHCVAGWAAKWADVCIAKINEAYEEGEF